MKIALIVNTEKEGALKVALEAAELLGRSGAEVLTSNVEISGETVGEEELYTSSDLVLTVGGDGTIIRAAKKAAINRRPVLGINVGRVGFLAEVERDKLSLLERLVTGEFTVSPRFMLKAEAYENTRKISEGVALNDAVLAAGGIANLLDFELDISSATLSYRADGLIVSTPTGSTAYSMSAGGPIIDYAVRCFAVTPICSHSLTTRPMIIGENERLCLRLPSDWRGEAVFSLDGRFCANVNSNTYIKITKAPYDALFVNLNSSGIYKTLSKKFRR